MTHKIENQVSFASILFDTLFGLIIYFNIDSFLEIKDPVQMVFYIASLVLTVHWWMLLKSAADIYDNEVSNSAINIVFGIVEIVLIEHIALMAKNAEYLNATIILVVLLAVDLVWCLAWRFLGKWSVRDGKKIKIMEKELNYSIYIDVLVLSLFGALAIFGPYFSPAWFVGLFSGFLLFGIFLAYRYKVIDLKFF